MEQQLANWRSSLESEVAVDEKRVAELRATIADKRERIAAIDRLLGVQDGQAVSVVQLEDLVDDVTGHIFTPVGHYWMPILLTLSEVGGRGRREQVTELVGKKMSSILTSADHEKLARSNLVRWKNRVAWQVSNMRAQGLVKKHSPRGIWEITDAGRRWVEENRMKGIGVGGVGEARMAH